jgi:hypothetical protein
MMPGPGETRVRCVCARSDRRLNQLAATEQGDSSVEMHPPPPAPDDSFGVLQVCSMFTEVSAANSSCVIVGFVYVRRC